MTAPTVERARLSSAGSGWSTSQLSGIALRGSSPSFQGSLPGALLLSRFGFDRLIEVTSGVALRWRLHCDHDERGREGRERRALRIVGASFVALAGYVPMTPWERFSRVKRRSEVFPVSSSRSFHFVVMPLLAPKKTNVARSIGSAAMTADAKQTELCTYLSAILLGGLILNAAFGLWWADPVAALVMVPIIGKEGIEALQGKACGCSEGACH